MVQIEQQLGDVKLSEINQLPPQSSLGPIFLSYKKNIDNLKAQIKTLVDDTNKCLTLHEQRESLLKSQLNESRVKCELLEQSLRILAQENHDMETKKLHHDKHASGYTSYSQNLESTNSQNENSLPVEEKITSQWYQIGKESSDNESEEFFDIEDSESEDIGYDEDIKEQDEVESDEKSNDLVSSDSQQFSNYETSNFSRTGQPADEVQNFHIEVEKSTNKTQALEVESFKEPLIVSSSKKDWRLVEKNFQ